MRTLGGRVNAVEMYPGRTDALRVNFANQTSCLFSLGDGAECTIDGRKILGPGELFNWLADPARIAYVVVNQDPQFYGLSLKTEFNTVNPYPKGDAKNL